MKQIGSHESEELQAKINASEPEIQQYIAALKTENAKIHKRIVKLEADNLSANNRVIALEQHFKEQEHFEPLSPAASISLDKLAERH